MAYLIAEPCIDELDQSCVAVCPVDCIRFEDGTDRKAYIDPCVFAGWERGELAKLMLYKGDDATPVSVEDCEAVIGDSSTLFLDDAAFAAFGGDFALLTDALTRCESAGESPVAILRVAQKHGQKLHLAAATRESGGRTDPTRLGVHWTRRDGFERQSKLWSSDRLMRALEILTEAERLAKSTGRPAAAASGDALLRIARAARVAR